MRWLCVLVLLVALVRCSESQDRDGTGGTGGSPPPANVDQTCRDWCANEPEGFSCHGGPPESVEDCYRDCLWDYQQETERECEDEWIAIKDCELDLDCEDLFGDCDSFEEQLDECRRLSANRDYCEANCPDLDIAQCEEDTSECRQLVEERQAAAQYCEVVCPNQELSECIDEYLLTGSCNSGTGGTGGSSGVCADNSECVDGQFCDLDDSCSNQGACVPIPETCDPADTEQVCGCDGNTYANECMAHRSSARVSAIGACDCETNDDCAASEYCNAIVCDGPGVCEPRNAPCEPQGEVTGCDGIVYESACVAASEGIRVRP